MNHPMIDRIERTGYPRPEPPARTGTMIVTVTLAVEVTEDDEIRSPEEAREFARNVASKAGVAVDGDWDLIDHEWE